VIRLIIHQSNDSLGRDLTACLPEVEDASFRVVPIRGGFRRPQSTLSDLLGGSNGLAGAMRQVSMSWRAMRSHPRPRDFPSGQSDLHDDPYDPIANCARETPLTQTRERESRQPAEVVPRSGAWPGLSGQEIARPMCVINASHFPAQPRKNSSRDDSTTSVANNRKQRQFQTSAFTNVQAAFGTSSAGPWVTRSGMITLCAGALRVTTQPVERTPLNPIWQLRVSVGGCVAISDGRS
jgi:hypothetical protein